MRWRQCKASSVSHSLLLLVILLPLHAAYAHLPEYFGRIYVLDTDEEPPPKPCQGDRRQLRQQAESQRLVLEEKGKRDGAYSIEMADPRGELAKLYVELCNSPAALKEFREAIQRLRISEGLLTKSQLPYLKGLAQSYRAIGDFESAQRSMRTALRIHGMGVEPLDDAALRDLLEYFQFARDVFIDPRAREDVSLFFEAFSDTRRVFDAQLELSNNDAAQALGRSHLLNLYLLLGTDLDTGYAAASQAGGSAWDFFYRSQQLTYSKGKKLLAQLIELRQSEGEPVADLYFELGNWQMWSAKAKLACETYAQAWLLAKDSSPELLKQMAQPAELPEDPALWRSLQNQELDLKAVVAASFRVSKRGNVSQMDATMVDEADSVFAAKVGRWLRDSHMRPAIVDGVCVDADSNGRQYRLLD